MNKQPTAQKTCVICGLEKQLVTFLQISGPQGTTYGNICSTCRGSGLGKKIIIPSEPIEESSSTGFGLKIDGKAKVFSDNEKKQLAQTKAEEKEKSIQEREEKKQTKSEKIRELEETEKKHREEYIKPNKSFLTKKTSDTKAPSNQFITDIAANKQQQNLHTQHQEAAAKEDELVKTTDFTNSFWDPAIAGGIKQNSAEFLKVRAWLGESAAANKTRNINSHPDKSHDAEHKITRAVEKKSSTSSMSTFSKTFSQPQTNKPESSPMVEFINEKWGSKPPGSKR
jgi:hypothetical protein